MEKGRSPRGKGEGKLFKGFPNGLQKTKGKGEGKGRVIYGASHVPATPRLSQQKKKKNYKKREKGGEGKRLGDHRW